MLAHTKKVQLFLILTHFVFISIGICNVYSEWAYILVKKKKSSVDLFKEEQFILLFYLFLQAFDKVGRKALGYKLTKLGRNGKLFDVIRNLCRNVKSCIFLKGFWSVLRVSSVSVTSEHIPQL